MSNDRTLNTEIMSVPMGQLKHVEVNARYMTAEQQARLTENIKADGGLTSLPLVWLIQDMDGTQGGQEPRYEIISGNHRVISAKDAGLEEIDVIVITNWISEGRRVEIQLAHNAVSGQDDLSILETLYEGLDLNGKIYSGLTDDAFDALASISVSGFSVDSPAYQEITLTFLPEDEAEFLAFVDRAQKTEDVTHLVASMDTFDDLFDVIVGVKEHLNIQNNAMAISTITELARERLDQLKAEIIDQPSEEQDNEEDAPDGDEKS